MPNVAVLDAPPVGTSFSVQHVALAGEIWSPGNAAREQRPKPESYALAEVPSF